MWVNIGIAILGAVFTIRELWLLYVIGIFIFMCLMPAAEAAEQTVIQRVVPFKRQGRVFGLAQAVEAASSPLTAFIIAPVAQFMIIPYMQSGTGRQAFGWLLGEGEARGIALVFVIASMVIFIATLIAFRTRAYRQLSEAYRKA